MRLSNKIVFASLNREKFEEFQSILRGYPELELIPVEKMLRNAEGLRHAEKYDSYLENAIAKARLANFGSHYPPLADDTGLEVEALGGKPGVRSHRYSPPKPRISQDQANVELLLTELKGHQNRTARFICTVVLVIEGVLLHATGALEGTIAEAPRGNQGFGYDPVFIPKGHSKTLAEMSSSEKNEISHRRLAIQQLMIEVKKHGIIFAKP